MIAVTSLPSLRPRSDTASTVIDATSRWPATSRTTLAIASPLLMLVTVPASWLRAVSFTDPPHIRVASTNSLTDPEPSQRRTPVSSNVSERQAREVAEAARESEWKLPSFREGRFLGHLFLDFCHSPP